MSRKAGVVPASHPRRCRHTVSSSPHQAPVSEHSSIESPNETFATVSGIGPVRARTVEPHNRRRRERSASRRKGTTMENRRLRRYLRHGMLPQLAAFDAVMRLGSVTQASAALHMAQPTVSGHLRKLSDAVGVPLFRCDGRRMLPTAPARALHEGALGVFAALHDLDCALEPLRSAPSAARTAAVGAQPMAA